MRRPLRFALLGDGTSDRALVHVIRWAIMECRPDVELAPPGFRNRNPSAAIADEMQEAVRLFAPDVLFVHRDAEREDPEVRRREIPDSDNLLVRIVPVRMTEAWFLFDEAAIRVAAGNPRGRADLDLPPLVQIESLPDPKSRLHSVIIAAAGVTGRRRKLLRRDLPATVQRVAELIRDFRPLQQLSAFRTFERDCREALQPSDPDRH